MNHDQNISDENDHHIRELQQKINILLELEKEFTIKIDKLQESNIQLKEKIHSKSRNSKELEQEKLIQKEMKNLDTNNSKELEVTKQNLKDVIHEKDSMARELEQQKLIMNDIHQTMVNKISELEESNKDLKEKMSQKSLSSRESEQEKIFMEKALEVETKEKEKAKTKYYKAIIVSVLAIAVVSGVYSVMFAELAGQQYRVEVEPQTTGYTIQNLRGDIIDTYLSWRLVEGDTIVVNILSSAKYDDEVIETVKKTILSEEILEIDNSLLHKGPKGTTSLMYVGWQGAMAEAAKTETILYVPAKFEVIESKSGEGYITIELTNSRNADGFAGWTNSIADASQNQILKSRITIFAVDSLSLTALETVVRHELGHALGLAHSTAPEDLMYPVIETNFPYVSECDVDAIEKLYDGGKSSQVVCEI